MAIQLPLTPNYLLFMRFKRCTHARDVSKTNKHAINNTLVCMDMRVTASADGLVIKQGCLAL